MGPLLNLAYATAVLAAAPLLLYRAAAQGKYRHGWSEKLLGRLPRRTTSARCIWFHAVSVGEVLLLRSIIDRLNTQFPDLEIWISTTTQTGHAIANEKFPGCRIVYFPLDFTWAVENALNRVRPDLIVLVELELWPNFIRAARRRGIPLTLVNGRMSERSFRGYRRVRPLMSPILQSFDAILVQTPEYRDRLEALGAPAQRLRVTGSVKYDGLETDRANPRTENLRRLLGIRSHERVFIAGSTQAPEEEYALAAYRVLCKKHPGLRLILAPRHRERFEEAAALVRAAGFSLLRRSQDERLLHSSAEPAEPENPPPVILLDTLGELSACWGLAEIAFVGGSLSRRGGQNMIEPAAYGAAVLFGPHTHNFRQAVELLLSRDAALVVRSFEELTATLDRLLASPSEVAVRGRTAQELVQSQRGATAATIDGLTPWLASPQGSVANSRANREALPRERCRAPDIPPSRQLPRLRP